MTVVKVEDARAAAAAPPAPVLALPPEVAEFMHTTEGALAQDRYLGRGIPYVKHGRKVLYRWADVYAYVNENTVIPGGPDAA